MFAYKGNFNSAGGSVDPYWTNVSFLENFDQAPTGYTDSSGNNHPLPAVGGCKPMTNSPFAGYQGSLYFSTGYLVTPYTSDFDLSGSSWTMEAWINSNSFASAQTVMSKDTYGVNYDWAMEIPNSTTISIHTNGYNSVFTATVPAMSTGTWYHIAIVRDSGTLKIYLNGTSYSGSSAMAFTNASQVNVTIGCFGYNNPTNYFNGYVSNVRIVKGTAVYTSNFTPSTVPLTAISGTSLLINTSNQGLQNNSRTIDISTNNFTVTTVGSPGYTNTSPFGTDYPGSWYTSNGLTNYLTVPDNNTWAFSGDFCIESWVYPTSVATMVIMSQWSGAGGAANQAWIFYMTSTNRLSFSYGIGSSNVGITGTSQTINQNQWNHLAVTRSGTTVRLFINGVQDSTTGTVSGTINNVSYAPMIARIQDTSGGGSPYFGYLSNLRIVNGSAVYTSNFTPSTTPLTAITNTALLLPLTGALYDLSKNNNIITNTSTTNSACVITNANNKKFGIQSLQFNSSGTSYQTVLDSTSLQLGSGNLTVEGWVYRNAAGAVHGLICKGASTTGWGMSINASNQLLLFVGTTTLLTSTTTIGATTWTHFAWTRSGSTNYLFVNGNLEATATDSTNFTQTNNMFIGCNRTNATILNGYLDDLRITKGIARYTSSFTAPTKPNPTKGKP